MKIKKFVSQKMYFWKGFFLLCFLVPVVGLGSYNFFHPNKTNQHLSSSLATSASESKQSSPQILRLLGFDQESWKNFRNEKLDEDGLKIFLAIETIKNFQKFYKKNSDFLPKWNQTSLVKNLPSQNSASLAYQHFQLLLKLIAEEKSSNFSEEENKLLLTIIQWLGLKFQGGKLQKSSLAESLTILANWFDLFMEKHAILESDSKSSSNGKAKIVLRKKKSISKILKILKDWGFSVAQILELSKIKLTAKQKNLVQAIVKLLQVAKKGVWPLLALLTSSASENQIFKTLFILFLYTDLPLPTKNKNLTIIKNKVAQLKQNWTATKFQIFKDILFLTKNGIDGSNVWLLAKKIDDLLNFSSDSKSEKTFATTIAERTGKESMGRITLGLTLTVGKYYELGKEIEKGLKEFGKKLDKVKVFVDKLGLGKKPKPKPRITEYWAYDELWKHLKFSLVVLDTALISKIKISSSIIVDFDLIKSEPSWETKDFKDLSNRTKKEVAKLKVFIKNKNKWIDLVNSSKNIVVDAIDQYYGSTWNIIRPYIKNFKKLKQLGIDKLGDLRLDSFFLYKTPNKTRINGNVWSIKRYYPSLGDDFLGRWDKIIDFTKFAKPSEFLLSKNFYLSKGREKFFHTLKELDKLKQKTVVKTEVEMKNLYKNIINEEFSQSFNVLKIMLTNVKFVGLDKEYEDIVFSTYNSLDNEYFLQKCIEQEKSYSLSKARKICLQDYDKKFPLKNYLNTFDFSKIKQNDLSTLSFAILDKLKFFKQYQKAITTLVNAFVTSKLLWLTNNKATQIWDNFQINNNAFSKIRKKLQLLNMNKVLLKSEKDKPFFFDLNQFSLLDLETDFKNLSSGAKGQLINLIDTEFSDFVKFKKAVSDQINFKYNDFWKLLQKGYSLGFQNVYNSFFTNSSFANEDFTFIKSVNGSSFTSLSLSYQSLVIDLYQSHKAINEKLSLLITKKFGFIWTLLQSYSPLLESIGIKQLEFPQSSNTSSLINLQFLSQNFHQNLQDLKLDVFEVLEELQSKTFANQTPVLIEDIEIIQKKLDQATENKAELAKDLVAIKKAHFQYQVQKQREKIALEKYFNKLFLDKFIDQYFSAGWKEVEQKIDHLKAVSQIGAVKKTADKLTNLIFVEFWNPIWTKLKVKLNFLKKLGINQLNTTNDQKLHLNSFFQLQNYQDISQFSEKAKEYLVQVYPQLEQINKLIEQKINSRYGLLWEYLVLALKLKVTSFLKTLSVGQEVLDLTFFDNSDWFKLLPAKLPINVLIKLNQFYFQKEKIVQQLINVFQNLKFFKKSTILGQFNQILPRLKERFLTQKFQNEKEVWNLVYQLLEVPFLPYWKMLEKHLPKLQVLGIEKLKSNQFFQDSDFFDLTPFLSKFDKRQFRDLDFLAFKELKKLVGTNENDLKRVINDQLEQRFGLIWKTIKPYLVEFQEKSINKLTFDDQNKLLTNEQTINLFPLFAVQNKNVDWINSDLEFLTELNKIYVQKTNWDWNKMLIDNLINSESGFDVTFQPSNKTTIIAVASGVGFLSLTGFAGLVWWIRKLYSN